jgi:hypothetical protein
VNWADERWRKVYIHDTTDWKCLSWEAQALFLMLIRKVNEAGVLDLGRRGRHGLTAHVKMPWEVAGPALDELEQDGCIQVSDDQKSLLMTNFLEAQQAHSTDAERKRKYRDRVKAGMRKPQDVPEPGQAVHKTGQIVPLREHGVTSGHAGGPLERGERGDICSPIGEQVSFGLEGSEPSNWREDAIERAYQVYPYKRGKQKGHATLLKQIRNRTDAAALMSAVRHYAEETYGRPQEYMKYWSTFASDWKSWVRLDDSEGSDSTADDEMQRLREAGEL